MDLIVMTIVLTEMITVLIVMTIVFIVMNIKLWQLIHQAEILLSLKIKSKAWQITLNPNIIKVRNIILRLLVYNTTFSEQSK